MVPRLSKRPPPTAVSAELVQPHRGRVWRRVARSERWAEVHDRHRHRRRCRRCRRCRRRRIGAARWRRAEQPHARRVEVAKEESTHGARMLPHRPVEALLRRDAPAAARPLDGGDRVPVSVRRPRRNVAEDDHIDRRVGGALQRRLEPRELARRGGGRLAERERVGVERHQPQPLGRRAHHVVAALGKGLRRLRTEARAPQPCQVGAHRARRVTARKVRPRVVVAHHRQHGHAGEGAAHQLRHGVVARPHGGGILLGRGHVAEAVAAEQYERRLGLSRHHPPHRERGYFL